MGEREIPLHYVCKREEAEAILKEAEATHLVTRPFRDEDTRARVEGICFCCDDCCGYFTDPGDYGCGLCLDVCPEDCIKMEERVGVA